MEIWKPIEGYEGYYEVSNYGNVKSLARIVIRCDGKTLSVRNKLMTKTENSDGYYTVHLSKDGYNERVPIHILVAKTFVSGYQQGLEVDHLDTDRKNNVYTNLEWVTHEENNRRIFERGHHVSQVKDLHGKNNPNYGNHKLHEKYLNNPELCRMNQSRPGAQNGRAVSVKVTFKSGEFETFVTLRECAKYLINAGLVRAKKVDCVASRISMAIKDNIQIYNGLSFSVA